MGKFGFKWLALAGLVVAVFVAGWLAAASAGGGAAPGPASATETVTTTVTAKEGKDEGKGGEPAATSAEGAKVTWTGPLVEEEGLTGSQLDAVHARVRECLPIERAAFLELCLMDREQDWFDEGGASAAPSTTEDAE